MSTPIRQMKGHRIVFETEMRHRRRSFIKRRKKKL